MDLRSEVHTAGLRRLNALASTLPPESASKRATADTGVWTQELELFAAMLERLDTQGRQLFGIAHLLAGKKTPKLGPPFHYEHPDRPATRARIAEKAAQKPASGLSQLLGRLGLGR